MMQTRLFTLWVSFLILIALVDATTLTYEFVENSDLIAGCQFTLGRQSYNLCPLMLENSTMEVEGTGWEQDEEPSRRLYIFTLDGLLRDDRKCPEGTWICMSEIRYHETLEQTTYTPIAGKMRHESSLVDQGINARVSIYEDDNDLAPPPLSLFLIGGIHDDIPRYAQMKLICDPKSNSPRPSFTGEMYGVHSFTWSTMHACPNFNPTAPNDGVFHAFDNEDSNPTGEKPPISDGTGEEGDQELLNPKVPNKASRRWVAFVLLTTGTLLIAITLYLASPQRRVIFASRLAALGPLLRLPVLQESVRFLVPRTWFHTGEDRLVLWAQEDMSLGVVEREHGDFDAMVNGAGAVGSEEWYGDDADEYIPLKAGPLRHTRDYGSAHSGSLW